MNVAIGELLRVVQTRVASAKILVPMGFVFSGDRSRWLLHHVKHSLLVPAQNRGRLLQRTPSRTLD